MSYANVMILETEQKVRIRITSLDKPKIPEKTEKEWSSMLDNAAAKLKISAALITKVGQKDIEVFAKSTNKGNSYELKAKIALGTGLYCETVLARNRELAVSNAKTHPQWKAHSISKHEIISYYGLPIKWPDGEFFGTVCVLDKKPMFLSAEIKRITAECRIEAEKSLACLADDIHAQ